MTRALFFLLDSASNASSRHRVLQYLPYLQAHGVEGRAVEPVPARLAAPLSEGAGTTGKMGFYALFFALRLAAIMGASRHHVVVIQRDLFPYGPPLLERSLHRVNPHLLYDTDDATHIPPPFTPRNPFQRLRRFDKVAEVLRLCRQVTVATPALAAYARQFNPNVTIIPMAIDWERYSRAAAKRPSHWEGGPVTIGWTGTAGGALYLRELAPALGRVARRAQVRYRIVSGAWRAIQLPGVDWEAVPWTLPEELELLGTFDVGIVPLADTAFERAKFPFKLLQYMALGIPPLCARLGMAEELIQDGVNGFLAGSEQEWEERLVLLAQDAELRRRMGAAARETVRDRFTLENTAPLLLAALERAAG